MTCLLLLRQASHVQVGGEVPVLSLNKIGKNKFLLRRAVIKFQRKAKNELPFVLLWERMVLVGENRWKR